MQIGKTGAWLLMIQLLHDHLRSSQGVMVENYPLPPSMFLLSSLQKLLTSNAVNGDSAKGSPTSGGSSHPHFHDHHYPTAGGCAQSGTSACVPSLKHSHIVPLEHLFTLNTDSDESKDVIKLSPTLSPRDTPIQSSAESSSSLPVGGSGFEARHVISISVSPYMSYDFTHSCNECSKYVRGNSLVLPEFLTFSLPCSPGGGQGGGQGGRVVEKGISIKWCVPSTQQKHCIISANRKTLEMLKLPVMKVRGEKSPLLYPMTPVFTPTFGRDSSGLFNLFHSQYYHIHVLVTSESEFGKYCKAWPNHLVMALPDKEATGLGK